MSQLSLRLIVILALLNIFGVFVNAYKWRLLLPEARFSALVKTCFMSYYFGLLLPGQISQEAAKVYYLNRGKSLRTSVIAASVLVDKIGSIIGLLIVGCVGLALSETRLPRTITWFFLLLGVGAMVILFVLRLPFAYAKACHFFTLAESLLPRQQRIINGCRGLIDAWHQYSRDVPVVGANILLGVVYQYTGVLMLYLLARAFYLQLGFFDWGWIAALVTLAVFLPVTIGGLGIREGTLISIFQIYGCSNEKAIAVSLSAFSFGIMLAIIGAILGFVTDIRKKCV